MEIMETRIKMGEIKEVVKQAITRFKEVVQNAVPKMAEADVTTVFCSVKDPMSLAVRPQTEDTKQLLKDLMPMADIPSSS